MSEKEHFKIEHNLLILHSLFYLCGIVLAAVFIAFSSSSLQNEFFERFQNYFTFSSHLSCIVLAFQECFWILMLIFLSRVPSGRVACILILLYKGFSVGIVSSIACRQLGFSGLKYILFLVLPQNVLYLLSLCLGIQISFEIAHNHYGKHNKQSMIGRSIYLICFLLTLLGAVIESYFVPWIYKIFF